MKKSKNQIENPKTMKKKKSNITEQYYFGFGTALYKLEGSTKTESRKPEARRL